MCGSLCCKSKFSCLHVEDTVFDGMHWMWFCKVLCFHAHTETYTQAQSHHTTDSLRRLERILANISFCSHISTMGTEVLWCHIGCGNSCLCQAVVQSSEVHLCVYTLGFNCLCLWILYSGWNVARQAHDFLTFLDAWTRPIIASLVHTSLASLRGVLHCEIQPSCLQRPWNR